MCKKYKTYTKIPHIFEFKRKKKGRKKTGKRERKFSLSLVHLSCINNKTWEEKVSCVISVKKKKEKK